MPASDSSRGGGRSRLSAAAARQFTLGGVLSIANGLCWVCLFAGVRHLPEWAVDATTPLMLVLSLPVATTCVIHAVEGGSSVIDAVLAATTLGINGLLWGHGVAWIVRKVARWCVRIGITG